MRRGRALASATRCERSAAAISRQGRQHGHRSNIFAVELPNNNRRNPSAITCISSAASTHRLEQRGSSTEERCRRREEYNSCLHREFPSDMLGSEVHPSHKRLDCCTRHRQTLLCLQTFGFACFVAVHDCHTHAHCEKVFVVKLVVGQTSRRAANVSIADGQRCPRG